MNLLARIPVAIFQLISFLSRQRKFLQQHVVPELEKIKLTNDGSLEPGDFRKILHYYGLAVPAVLGEAFCRLHSKQMTAREREASTAQGAMTGLFDDFFDKTAHTAAAIEVILSPSAAAKTSNEELFLLFYKSALGAVPDQDQMLQALQLVHQAQAASMGQLQDNTSSKEIATISFEKGGTSLLFYRTAFSPSLSMAEKELLYRLGAFMQLANDIFDVYKDRENGIRTLVTETQDINEIISIFRKGISEANVLMPTTGMGRKACTKFYEILSLAIFSRALVCLQQLKQLQFIGGGTFSIHQYSRSELICDMQKPRNLISSASYHRKLMMDFEKSWHNSK